VALHLLVFYSNYVEDITKSTGLQTGW